MTYTISGANIIIMAVGVWFLGTYLNKKVSFLERYSIPVAVTGGLICSAIITGLYYIFDFTVNFDTGLRDLLLLTFFSTIGLTAKISLLRQGGKILAIALAAAVVLLVLQNVTGVLLAMAFGAHPGYGLFGGSISLAGGYGTAIAWGEIAERSGLSGAKEIGIAFATFGLIAGGIMGGPIAEWLIKKRGLQDVRNVDSDGEQSGISDETPPQRLPPLSAALGTLLVLAVCVGLGDLVNQFLFAKGVTLPGFLTAMFVGIIITNAADIFKFQIDDNAREGVAELSLQLFLAMSLMSMQLWILAGALGIILIIIFAQMAVITIFSMFVVFRVLGRDYDAAVMVAGFTGLGMGATPVGIANMNAITSKYAPSAKAFLIIPLIGAFFIDIANAFIIKIFLAMPFMQTAGT